MERKERGKKKEERNERKKKGEKIEGQIKARKSK